MNSNFGCHIKDDCFLCKYFLIETDSFKSFECDTKFKIKDYLDCCTEGIIYLLLDLICKRSYTGSTIYSMTPRMSNYKNHIKTQHKDCEMAQHFAVSGSDVHPFHGIGGDVSSRSKQNIDFENENLSKQIKVIIIEKVDLSNVKTTKEKRHLIEVREGFWQTQLRTLSHYGGLNKKDERKITHNRLARNICSFLTKPPTSMIHTPSESSTNQPPSHPLVRKSARTKGKAKK